jgi:predicted metal-dependent hydrolase
MVEYDLIQSKRRSISIEISREGRVFVRAPFWLSKKEITSFVERKESWIQRSLAKCLNLSPPRVISKKELESLRQKAKNLILPRVEYWSSVTGLGDKGAKITSARTRFGSCSGKNSISLSLFLAEFPLYLIDYVIIHELCHTIEHNHSSSFYCLLEKFVPNWRLLKEEMKSIPIPLVSNC